MLNNLPISSTSSTGIKCIHFTFGACLWLIREEFTCGPLADVFIESHNLSHLCCFCSHMNYKHMSLTMKDTPELLHLLFGTTGCSTAYNRQTYTLDHTSTGIVLLLQAHRQTPTFTNSNIYKMGGGQIALHITHKQWNLELSKLHDWVELASKFIATSLTDETGSRESNRTEQQDYWFVHYLHSINVLILSCCPLDQNI